MVCLFQLYCYLKLLSIMGTTSKQEACFKNSLTLIFMFSFPRNIIHGSDSVESAETEINLWFTPEELVDYRSCAHEWIYD